MTDLEKAQRKVMLELVLGKNHRESGNVSTNRGGGVGGGGPTITIPTAMITLATTTTTTTTKPIVGAAGATPKVTTEDTTTTTEEECKDPVDRKIEELLRQSLKNIQEGSHPFQMIPKLSNNDDDTDIDDSNNVSVTTPWKTQDDMAIDPEIYSPRVATTAAAVSMATSSSSSSLSPSTTIMMTTHATGIMTDLDLNSNTTSNQHNTTATTTTNNDFALSVPSSSLLTQQQQYQHEQHLQPVRQRSNSLPDGVLYNASSTSVGTTIAETNIGMETDGMNEQ